MFIKKRRSRELRENNIRNFVQSELNPKTRDEILTIIRMFRKEDQRSENDILIDYILESNDEFFNLYRMKNNMEQASIDAATKAAATKAAAKAAWVDAEARAYIRHQIHGILDGSLASHIANPALVKLAAEVKARAEEIVGSSGCEGIFTAPKN